MIFNKRIYLLFLCCFNTIIGSTDQKPFSKEIIISQDPIYTSALYLNKPKSSNKNFYAYQATIFINDNVILQKSSNNPSLSPLVSIQLDLTIERSQDPFLLGRIKWGNNDSFYPDKHIEGFANTANSAILSIAQLPTEKTQQAFYTIMAAFLEKASEKTAAIDIKNSLNDLSKEYRKKLNNSSLSIQNQVRDYLGIIPQNSIPTTPINTKQSLNQKFLTYKPFLAGGALIFLASLLLYYRNSIFPHTFKFKQ